MKEKLDKYDPSYSYEKNTINTGKSEEGYPIIERTTNALLYPECPRDDIDLNDISD